MSGTKAADSTEKSSLGRRLIAVLHADVVGYSRLIGLDDVGTLERLRALRSALIDPAIAEHGGRVVNTAGDSLLVVFDSVDGAVRCAMRVQKQVPVCDAEQPTDRAIRFRVGINVGDVIPDGTDIHGDAVNVAARLQAECPPGGICVSRAVRDHVQDRLNLAFEELGALTLKNIVRPVEVFVVRGGTGGVAAKSAEWSAYAVSDLLPLPDKPSIAVLAFTNLSGDIEQEYFSDGIAEDIITELSRNRGFFVIARNSSFSYRGRSVDVKQIGRELGVRYVVEGSVRRVGERARITVQLIDALTNNHIWAERYDRKVYHVFDVQGEIAEAVAVAIYPVVGQEEQRRAVRNPPGSLSSWETYQRGLWHFNKLTPAGNQQARRLFALAAEIDTGFASPRVMLSQAHLFDCLYYVIPSTVEATKLAEEEARKAITIDPDDPAAERAMAAALLIGGNYSAALEHADRALALNRNSAAAYRVRASALVLMGQWPDGRADAFTSLRLNPRDPLGAVTVGMIAASYYMEGDYQSTVEVVRRRSPQFPDFAMPRCYLVAALGQLGRRDEAAAALRELQTKWPSNFHNRPAYVPREHYEHMLEGLRKAGWQG